MNRSLLLLPVVLVLLGCEPASQDELPGLFDVVELTDGVYGAIATDTSEAMANAGIINFGDDRIVIFDTFLTPKAGAALKARAEGLLEGSRIFLVVNSNSESAHVRGNQVFKDNIILGTPANQERITNSESRRLENERANAVQMAAETREALRQDLDQRDRDDLEQKMAYQKAVANSVNDVVTTTSTLVWETRINFHGPARSVKIIPLGSAATQDDAVLAIVADSILFASDVVVVDRHPDMEESDLTGWRAALDSLDVFTFNHVVPGHGPVTDQSVFDRTRAYLDMVEQTAVLVRSGEINLEDARPRPPFDGLRRGDRFHPNVSAVIRKLDL